MAAAALRESAGQPRPFCWACRVTFVRANGVGVSSPGHPEEADTWAPRLLGLLKRAFPLKVLLSGWYKLLQSLRISDSQGVPGFRTEEHKSDISLGA